MTRRYWATIGSLLYSLERLSRPFELTLGVRNGLRRFLRFARDRARFPRGFRCGRGGLLQPLLCLRLFLFSGLGFRGRLLESGLCVLGRGARLLHCLLGRLDRLARGRPARVQLLFSTAGLLFRIELGAPARLRPRLPRLLPELQYARRLSLALGGAISGHERGERLESRRVEVVGEASGRRSS